METFHCAICQFEAPFKHFGASLPVDAMHSDAGAPGGGACRVAFLEQGWLAVDPFSVKARPLLLGAPCSLCQRPVCVADACSVFYAKRFCLHCARANAAAFPPAVHKAAPAIFGGAAAAGGCGGSCKRAAAVWGGSQRLLMTHGSSL